MQSSSTEDCIGWLMMEPSQGLCRCCRITSRNRLCKYGQSLHLNSCQLSCHVIISMGQSVRQWLGGRTRAPIFMVETHLSGEDHLKMTQWFSRFKRGTSGGFMILYPAHMHMRYLQHQVLEGCGWYAVMWEFNNQNIIMIACYSSVEKEFKARQMPPYRRDSSPV